MYRMLLSLGIEAARMHLIQLGIELDILMPYVKEVKMMVSGVMTMN